MSSRSLGVLTLDLVAKVGGFVSGMDKSERSSAKWKKQVEKDLKTIGAAAGTAGLAVAAGLAAMTVASVKQAGEISKLAAISGESTDAFQRYAAGAKAVGVEQDKLADIFKDANEKLGEFIQTGGGPLADFFENIAPKVGVTADQFAKLSGPDALGLYVSSLEKAGASQKEMTFYLESIASDATLLLPLLKNNSAGFQELGDAAAAAGAIMDESTIRAANELAATTILAEQAVTGLNNQLMTGLLPVLSDLSGELFEVSANTAVAEEAGEALGVAIKGVAATAFGAYSAFQLVGKSIGAMAAAFGEAGVESSDLLMGPLSPAIIAAKVGGNLDKFKDALDIGFEDIGKSVEDYASVLDGIWEAGAGGRDGQAEQRIKGIAAMLEDARKASASAGAGIVGDEEEKTESSKKTTDAVLEQLSAMERAAAVWGMSANEVELYDLKLKGASETQVAYARSLLSSVDALDQQNQAQEKYKDLLEELRTDEERLTDQMRERLKILDSMPVSSSERSDVAGRIADVATVDAPRYEGLAPEIGGQFSELGRVDDAQQELEKWYETQMGMLETFRAERADLNATWDEEELKLKQQHQDELTRIETARNMLALTSAEGMFGSLAEIARVAAGENSKTYKAMFALEKAAAIARSAVAIQTGIAMAAAVPWPANLAAMASVAASTASIIGNIQSIGMAHDGIDSVPKTGTWLLEKGERVTTERTSAKLDRTLDEIRGGNIGMRSGGPNQEIKQTFNISTPNADSFRMSEGQILRRLARGIDKARRYT